MVHVVLDGHRVDLEPLDGTFVIRGRSAALDALTAHLRSGLRVLAGDEEAGALVVEGDGARIQEAIRAARLARRLRVEPAYHQVGGPAGDLWAPTGRVTVRLSGSVTKAKAVLGNRGLRVVERLDDMPGGYIAVTDGDAIEAARA